MFFGFQRGFLLKVFVDFFQKVARDIKGREAPYGLLRRVSFCQAFSFAPLCPKEKAL
jgi:hypothetical protein